MDPGTSEVFAERMVHRSKERYVLSLYIAGMTPRSTMAVERIRSICDSHLAGRYDLTIVDLYLQPEAARRAQIVVVPTLVKQTPAPMRVFIGDMTDEKRILHGLNITLEPGLALEQPPQ